MATTDLFNRVVVVNTYFLGPAAERFTERLIAFHLNKSPSELNQRDLPKLTEWIKVSLGLLTNDKSLVDECEQKLLKLK